MLMRLFSGSFHVLPWTSLLPALMGLAICALSPSLAMGEELDRIRALEEKLREVSRELESLKDAAASKSAEGQGRASEASRPAASGNELSETEPIAADPQVTKDRLDGLESRFDQLGIQARQGEGIVLEDPRGNWALRVGGRVQLDYRRFTPNGAVADTFGLRRARFGVDATLLRDYRIVVEAEYANGNATGTTAQNVALTLGYFDVGTFAPHARIRLGQFKPAFGYEQTLLDLYSDYMERSFGQSLLQNLNYDRGLMIYGVPVKGLWYGVTVGNGVGQNLEEKQSNSQEVDAAHPEWTTRLTGNFAQFLDLPDRILQVGASYRRGEIANSAANPYVAASVQTEARGVTFFTPAAFNATGQTAGNINREHFAYEYLFALGPVKLQGEHFEVAYGGTRSSPAPSLDFKRKLKADYISAMWLVTGEHYADFFRDSTIGKIRPRNRFARGAQGGWGALELGLRYSSFDGSDFSSANPARTGQLGATAPVTTSTTQADAFTFQVKWVPNIFTRFWLDLVRTEFDTPVVANGVSLTHENALAIRTQIDF